MPGLPPRDPNPAVEVEVRLEQSDIAEAAQLYSVTSPGLGDWLVRIVISALFGLYVATAHSGVSIPEAISSPFQMGASLVMLAIFVVGYRRRQQAALPNAGLDVAAVRHTLDETWFTWETHASPRRQV